ncbi:hypothetical protein DFJ73DRAFT_623889 [Zopfochytrium polystomum]|nr:hypothetical protein DFJ73DRAFT_623889 [Zopfochytrium polystomum]
MNPPVVAPGAVSSHAHTIAGASGFSPTAAFDSLQKSSCSSCVVSADKSNYWSPPLFYINQNKTYTYIPTGVTTYYEVRGKDYNYEFPKGFGMIVGNYLRRGLTGNQTDRAISWLCIGGTNVNNGEAQPIPQSCTGDIRAQVQFPVCNDGRLFTKDGSHMSFAYNKDGTINFDGGSCPPTHPKRFVKLFVEVLYKAGDLKTFPFHTNKNEPRFVLSTGDVMGYSFHVDFLNGWKTGVLQNIIDNCDYGGGFNFFDPSNCKYIKDNFYQTNAVRTTCRVTDSAVVSKQEALVYNPSKGSVAPFAVSRLPGCNPVQATPFTGTCSAANLVASSSSKAAVA